VRGAVLVPLLLLAGCAHAQPPRPPPAPEVVRVLPPAALMDLHPEPEVPAAGATQRDVARYLLDLYAWAEEGWARLTAVKEWSDGRR